MANWVNDPQVHELVRYFEPGYEPVTKREGKTLSELAELDKIASALQTFLVVSGEVLVSGLDDTVSVRSGEFFHSPKYYIDARVFPFAEVREHYVPTFHEVRNPQWGIRDRFGNWYFEEERPEIVNRKVDESLRCPNCKGSNLSYATNDPLSDAQMSCSDCGQEGTYEDFSPKSE